MRSLLYSPSPDFSKVVTATMRPVASAPSASSSQLRTIRNVDTVSAVAPDFAIARTSVLFGTIDASALAVNQGSMLSRITSLGCRSEEHTSELQSLRHLVCRLL